MGKKVTMVGLVAMSLVLTLGTEAKAQNIWNVQFFWGTITCDSFLNGIPKKEAERMLVKCAVVVQEVSLNCSNPSGQESSSHLFRPQTIGPLTTSTPVVRCTPEKDTGKWNCDQTIRDDQIVAALKQDPSFPKACPSRNWTFDLDAVTQMIGNVTLLSCDNPTTESGCSVEDTFSADCSLPTGEDQYNCAERR